MRGFKNQQGTFFRCSEIGERNWLIKRVSSDEFGPTARNVCKNPAQRLDTGPIPTPWWFTPELEQQLLAIGDDGKLPSGSGGAGSSSQTDAEVTDSILAQLSADQLRTRLRSQLEYYFSRENLNQDRYLRSQMDGDQYVPIRTVASFNKISQLTSDLDLIVQVLKESNNVQVDETGTKVRAAHRRCTLLLREIPEFTDRGEVEAMFAGCPPYTSLTYGLNNSWYVSFESEEDTQLAFLELQKLRKSFNGKQISVRIKTGGAPLTDPADPGRFSPGARSDSLTGLGHGVCTIVTSTGTITGIAGGCQLVPNCPEGEELSLDRLMGPFGYTVRAIFQPRDSKPPLAEPPSELFVPETDLSAVGPPSTEIVGSLLSAAAEANESRKREREHQQQTWRQIMDGLAPMPSIMGGQRITDAPFISRGPILRRYTSQESSDVETALEFQRAVKQAQKAEQGKESKPAHAHTHSDYHHSTASGSNSYRGGSSRGKDYGTHYGGGGVLTSNNNNISNNGYCGGERGVSGHYDRPRAATQGSYDRPRRGTYDRSSRGGRGSGVSGGGERHYQSTSTTTTYSNERSSGPYRRDDTRPRFNSERRPPRGVSHAHAHGHSSGYDYRKTAVPCSSAGTKQPLMETPPTQLLALSTTPTVSVTTAPPTTSVPSGTRHDGSSTAPSESASTTESSRKKEMSESSEGNNFNLDGNDFPCLVDKEQQRAPKPVPKVPPKFSAVVAGKKHETPEEKKSYAQTLK